MQAIEKLGVRVSNPDQSITIEGMSFAELVLFEHLRAENLRRCVAVLALGNDVQTSAEPESERMAELQIQLQAMANASAGTLQELLRIARAQGLRFEVIGDLTKH